VQLVTKEGIYMNRIQIILAFVILLAFVGCSSGKSPVTPVTSPDQASRNSGNKSNRTIWGYWTISIDPDSETIEIVPDREAGLHFNVVRLLEVAPCTDCLSIINLSWLPDNIVQCGFQLTHPYPGLIKYTGFDVRGVLVTDGDTLFPVSNRFASLDGSNPYLLNPDGFTNLFNPVEFPVDEAPWPILGYIRGKLSVGDDFTGTLNPFMAFCMDNPRRMFEAGATETVTINLKYPSAPFEFGYVVDASWIPVDEIIDPETDFPPEANCLEPYRLEFQTSMQLFDLEGSIAGVQIEVFDHQGLDTISAVSVECPQLFDGEIYLDYSSQTSDDSWLFEGVITNGKGTPVGLYPVLVRVVSLESDGNLGELAAYQIEDINVLKPGDGHLIWARSDGGVGVEYSQYITTLSDDSTVVTGTFRDAATFGLGEANETELVSFEFYDIFVARYSHNGTLDWAKSAGSKSPVDYAYDCGYGITTLSDDSTVVSGVIYGSSTFGEGEAGEIYLETYGGVCNAFVARYGPDGALVWAKSSGGPGSTQGFGITTLSDDSTVATGYFFNRAIFGRGEPNEILLEAYGPDYNIDIYIARYNPDGTLAWAKKAGGANEELGNEITALSDNSIVVTGYFKGTSIFGEGEANETTLVSAGTYDIFIARYNPDGILEWAKRAGGTEYESGRDITTLSDNSTIVTGKFEGVATFGEGEPNETVLSSSNDSSRIFIARYNPDGTLAWAKQSGGPGHCFGQGITTLSGDSIVSTGRFSYTGTFGEGEPNETVLESAGYQDIFVARYNPDGTLRWAKSAGGTSTSEWGAGITALSDDSTVVTGKFHDNATFGDGEPNETILYAFEGIYGYDIFVARFAP